MDQYDYILINDDLQDCVDTMHEIIRSEHYRAQRNQMFIKEMKNDLEKYVKGAKQI